jgi:hypothetical protein
LGALSDARAGSLGSLAFAMLHETGPHCGVTDIDAARAIDVFAPLQTLLLMLSALLQTVHDRVVALGPGTVGREQAHHETQDGSLHFTLPLFNDMGKMKTTAMAAALILLNSDA